MKKKILAAMFALAVMATACGANETEVMNDDTTPLIKEPISTEAADNGDPAAEDASASDENGPVDYTDEIVEKVNEIVASSDSLSDELVKINELYESYRDIEAAAESQAEMNYLCQFPVTVWKEELSSLLDRIRKADQNAYDDIYPSYEEWLDNVNDIAYKMSYEYEGGSIQGAMQSFYSGLCYRNEAYVMASTLADLNDVVDFSLPERDAVGYYGLIDQNDHLIITEGMESGSYNILIHIDGKEELKGSATLNENGDFDFDDYEHGISGTVSYWHLGATFNVTEADGTIVSPGESYEFTYLY